MSIEFYDIPVCPDGSMVWTAACGDLTTLLYDPNKLDTPNAQLGLHALMATALCIPGFTTFESDASVTRYGSGDLKNALDYPGGDIAYRIIYGLEYQVKWLLPNAILPIALEDAGGLIGSTEVGAPDLYCAIVHHGKRSAGFVQDFVKGTHPDRALWEANKPQPGFGALPDENERGKFYREAMAERGFEDFAHFRLDDHEENTFLLFEDSADTRMTRIDLAASTASNGKKFYENLTKLIPDFCDKNTPDFEMVEFIQDLLRKQPTS